MSSFIDFQITSWFADDHNAGKPINSALQSAQQAYERDVEEGTVGEHDFPPTVDVNMDDGGDHDVDVDFDSVAYGIWIFGRSKSCHSISVRVDGFRPHFYVKSEDGSDLDDGLVESAARKSLCRYSGDSWSRHEDHLLRVEPVQHVEMWGFQNSEKTRFLKLTFKSMWAWRRCRNIFLYGKYPGVRTYESKIDPLTKFFHSSNIPTGGWARVALSCQRRLKSTTCDMEFVVDTHAIAKSGMLCPIDTPRQPAPLVEMAFDIEVFSATGSFPLPHIVGNVLFQIGVTVSVNALVVRKVILHLGQCASLEGVEVREYKEETDLLAGFGELVREIDPDVISSYNGDMFDIHYMFSRAHILGATESLTNLSRFYGITTFMRTDRFSSGAFGDAVYHRAVVPGRLSLDMLEYVRRFGAKYPTYSLNRVAQMELGDQKDDVPPKAIFAHYASRDPHRASIVAKYCVQDTHLVQRLQDKLDVLTTLFQMASAMLVTPSQLMQDGQSVRVMSLVTHAANGRGFLVPDTAPEDDMDVTGAIVIDPAIGAYYDPVAVFDFASLYPSVMIAYRVCYSTIVLDDKFRNLPGMVYEDISWTESNGERCTFTYAQNTPCVIAEIQEELYKRRQEAKKRKADAVRAGDVYTEK
ncbi:DNA polymerase delta catalytic subunit, partial [Gonapodya sp. JEL0774]